MTIGSAKEDFARRYIDGRLMMISRRYVKKYQPVEAGDAAKGYVGFGEVAKDLGHVLDVVWLSGTRTCLFSLAGFSFRPYHWIF